MEFFTTKIDAILSNEKIAIPINAGSDRGVARLDSMVGVSAVIMTSLPIIISKSNSIITITAINVIILAIPEYR